MRASSPYPKQHMSDDEFYRRLRRAFIAIAAAIEARYGQDQEEQQSKPGSHKQQKPPTATAIE